MATDYILCQICLIKIVRRLKITHSIPRPKIFLQDYRFSLTDKRLILVDKYGDIQSIRCLVRQDGGNKRGTRGIHGLASTAFAH